MLVPSTFTGWYKKIMIKAEIAREMIKSRSQTDRIGRGGSVIRGGGVGPVLTSCCVISPNSIPDRNLFSLFRKVAPCPSGMPY